MGKTTRAEKGAFLLFHEVRLFFEELTAEEQGRLFMALLDYSEFGREPEFTGMLRMAFRAIQRTMDRNTEKWEQTCAKRSEAGKKSAAAKAAKNFTEEVSYKMKTQKQIAARPNKRQQIQLNVNLNVNLNMNLNVNMNLNMNLRETRRAWRPPERERTEVWTMPLTASGRPTPKRWERRRRNAAFVRCGSTWTGCCRPWNDRSAAPNGHGTRGASSPTPPPG